MANPAREITPAPALRDVQGLLTDRESLGAVVLAASIPFVFLHERFQPEASLGIGSTTLDVRLSDLAILLVVAAAIVSAVRLERPASFPDAPCGSRAQRSSPG